jgi:hypothetical protein
MKVRFRQSGGFGGLVLGCDLDTHTLPPGEARALTRLVRRAKLKDLAPRRAGPARDLQTYEITVEGAGMIVKASLDDLSVRPTIEPLIRFLSDRARAVPLED